MTKKTCVLFVILLSLSTSAFAQQRCEDLFSTSSERFQDSIKQMANLEFNSNLFNDTVVFLDRVLNPTETPSTADIQRFNSLMSELNDVDAAQRKNVQVFLEKPVSDIQAVTLKFTRALGRTEEGLRSELPGFQGNYTQMQIARKDRALMLSGFSDAERTALLESDLVHDVLTKYSSNNFLKEIGVRNATQALDLNKETLSEMNKLNLQDTEGSQRIQRVDYMQANSLYQTVSENPVTSFYKSSKYDPQGGIGFCFGRAMTAHLEALAMGIEKESIRKVFVAGNMQRPNEGITWQFHVATIIKGNKDFWWVIDPIFEGPLKLEDWYERMYKMDASGQLRVFISEPARFGAIGNERYKSAHLKMDFYNNYFTDLVEYFKSKNKDQVKHQTITERVKDFFSKLLR